MRVPHGFNPPTIVMAPLPRESSRSYLIRLCMENGWPKQKDFLKRIGVTRMTFMERKNPTMLEAAFGMRPGALAILPDCWSKGTVQLNNHAIHVSTMGGPHRRVCRHCLAEEQVSHFEWELDFISHCPYHGPLVAECECGNPLSWGDRHLACCDRCPAVIDIKKPATAPVSTSLPCQEYLLGRLGRWAPSRNRVLDQLPLSMAVDITAAIGAFLEMGYRTARPVPRGALEKVDWVERGFSWLGGDGQDDVLSCAAAEFRRVQGTVCPKEPVRALGFVADLAAIQFRDATELTDLLSQRLGMALGYPVTDLWRSDYSDISACLKATGHNEAVFLRLLRENGWLHTCLSRGPHFFVPVDTLWQVGKLLKSSGVSQARS